MSQLAVFFFNLERLRTQSRKTKSRIGQYPEVQNPERTKSRIGQNPERTKSQNGQNPERPKSQNGLNPKSDKNLNG